MWLSENLRPDPRPDRRRTHLRLDPHPDRRRLNAHAIIDPQ